MAVKTTNKQGSSRKGKTSGKTAQKTNGAAKTAAQSRKKKEGASRGASGRGGGNEYGERTNPLLFCEIFLWMMLAFSIFLFISYFGIGGFVGEAVSSFFFGCFGVLA